MSLNRYISIAAKEASKSTCKFRLGAVAISNGQVISKGFNRTKGGNHKWSLRKGEQTIHAERLALNRTGSAEIDTLIVVRLAAATGFSMSHPCKSCMSHARRAGIKYIYYTDWNGNVQKVKVW